MSPLGPLAWGASGWGDEIAAGLWLTVRLALATLPVGLAIGFGVALMKQSRLRVVSGLGELYTTVFRGLPELLTIFLVYFGAPRLVGDISGFAAGLIALALVFGAFSSEVLLGAMRGVPDGQREAAEALGFSTGAAFRHVMLPQVWRLALPGLTNNWLVMLKDTSLVSVVALTELMRASDVAARATREPFLFYLVACLLYLALSIVSSFIAAWLERRAGRGIPTAGRA
ncbi:ABC transporter permease [Hansschlegelia quercus]|uniref:ABC transporter permease n=1 Tax=Hansschlegelia quercus TaxID=2528245 RepID=A0A4Q9GMW8_9HYPH|nr:ABC transporter permease [Hansschlegelia quercus]TBN54811.1 ABC transporter permease [Hansschlegelia quercus]